MSQYRFLKQADGQVIKVLTDDDGIIQISSNGTDYSNIEADAPGVVATVTGDFVDNTDPENPIIDAADAVTSAMIQDSSVSTAKIQDGAVTEAKIEDAAVSLAKMADVTGPVVLGRASGTGAPTAMAKANSQIAIGQKEYSQTLVGTAASIDLTVDGDTDGDYAIEGGGSFTSDPVTMKFQINGSDSGITALSADALVGGSPSTSFVIARNGLNPYTFLTGNVFTFTGRLTVKQGRVRSLSVTVFVKGNADQFSAGFSMDTFTVNGQRSTTNDNVTSFALVASASVLAAGSWMRLKALGTSA